MDGDQQQTRVTGNGAGSYLLAWEDDRNGNGDVYGSRFQPLRADFSAAPAYGAAPLQVEFGDESTPTSVADQWRWTFGDGGTDSAQHPTHTYTATGAYTVTLTVTDTETGEWDATTQVNAVAIARVITYILRQTQDRPTIPSTA